MRSNLNRLLANLRQLRTPFSRFQALFFCSLSLDSKHDNASSRACTTSYSKDSNSSTFAFDASTFSRTFRNTHSSSCRCPACDHLIFGISVTPTSWKRFSASAIASATLLSTFRLLAQQLFCKSSKHRLTLACFSLCKPIAF